MKKILYLLMIVFVVGLVHAQQVPDIIVLSDQMGPDTYDTTIWDNNNCGFIETYVSCTEGQWMTTKSLESLHFDTNEYYNITMYLMTTAPGGRSGRLLTETNTQSTTPGNRFGIYVGGQMDQGYYAAVPGQEIYIAEDVRNKWMNLIHNETGYYVLIDGVVKLSGTQDPSPKFEYFSLGDNNLQDAATAIAKYGFFTATLIDRNETEFYYQFDGNYSGTRDSYYPAYTWSHTSNLNFIDGIIGQAVHGYNYVGQRIKITTGQDYSFNRATVSFWAKQNDYEETTTEEKMLWIVPQAGGTRFIVLGNYKSAPHTNYVNWWSSQYGNLYAYDVWKDDAWTFFTWIMDGTDVKLYIDGVLANSVPHSGTWTLQDMNIGAMGYIDGTNDASYFNFDGSMDDLQMYFGTVKDEEWILNEYETQYPPPKPSGGGGGGSFVVQQNLKALEFEKQTSNEPILCKDNPAIGVVCDRFNEQPGLFLLLGIIVAGIMFGGKKR